jgi:uncharacterized protein YjbI with pentapeptide repeats
MISIGIRRLRTCERFANILGANISGANILGANISGANILGANILGANILGSCHSSLWSVFVYSPFQLLLLRLLNCQRPLAGR